MGWNDRLPEDPFIPSERYYQEREEYEAWLDYMEARLREEDELQLSSQNINPAALSKTADVPVHSNRGILARLWGRVFNKNTHSEPAAEQQDARAVQETPF